jgi:hypothetical protein
MTSDFHLKSDIRRKHQPHTLTIGSTIVLGAAYRTPYGLVPAGTKGFVEYIDEPQGSVWILMEGMEPALLHWDNRLIIVPYDTEDLVACLEVMALAPQNLCAS